MADLIPEYLPGQRPPREHPYRRLAESDWIQIGTTLTILERRVLHVCNCVRFYNALRQMDIPEQRMARNLEGLRNKANFRTVKEMIIMARTVRKYCVDFKEWLQGLVHSDQGIPFDQATNTGTRGWKLLFLRRIRQCQVHNRTLHIERNWIRALISGLPYSVHIDWQTLTVPMELDHISES